MLVITIQNQRFICIFPFVTMVTMAKKNSIHMNFKKFKFKIHSIQLYALVYGHFNNYYVKWRIFCKNNLK